MEAPHPVATGLIDPMSANAKEDKKMPTTMMSVDELASRWGVHHQTIRKAVDTGQIKAVRVGRAIRIARSHVEHLEATGSANKKAG